MTFTHSWKSISPAAVFFLLTNVYLNHLLTANSSHCVLCIRLDFSALLCCRCGFRYSALTVKKRKSATKAISSHFSLHTLKP